MLQWNAPESKYRMFVDDAQNFRIDINMLKAIILIDFGAINYFCRFMVILDLADPNVDCFRADFQN